MQITVDYQSIKTKKNYKTQQCISPVNQTTQIRNTISSILLYCITKTLNGIVFLIRRVLLLYFYCSRIWTLSKSVTSSIAEYPNDGVSRIFSELVIRWSTVQTSTGVADLLLQFGSPTGEHLLPLKNFRAKLATKQNTGWLNAFFWVFSRVYSLQDHVFLQIQLKL